MTRWLQSLHFTRFTVPGYLLFEQISTSVLLTFKENRPDEVVTNNFHAIEGLPQSIWEIEWWALIRIYSIFFHFLLI